MTTARRKPSPLLLVPVVDMDTATAFLTELNRLDMDYHFDDGAVECLYGNGVVTLKTARVINTQVDRCYAAWEAEARDMMHDCPIGYMLALMTMAPLAKKYPGHGFGISSADSCSVDNEDAPAWLVTFTGPHEMCIFDPLTNGFDACDPLATYGIAAEDAAAIREHNVVAAA